MADFQQFFESAPDAYLVLRADHDFTIVCVTDALLEMTGTQRAGIVGRPLFEVFPRNPGDSTADSVEKVRGAMQTAIATRHPQMLSLQRFDIRRPAAIGGEFERRDWRISISPILCETGTLTHLIHRVEDVTALAEAEEQRQRDELDHRSLLAQAEAASEEIRSRDHELARTHEQLVAHQQKLRETEARLEAAANVGEIATWIWEPQTDRMYADENLARWYHLAPDQAHGRSLAAYFDAVHPEDMRSVKETLNQSLITDSTVQVEYRIRGDSDTLPWRWVVARARIERDEAGRPIRLVGVVLDVTELRQTRQALKLVQERLSLAAEAAEIGSFSWSMPPGDIVSNARCKDHFWLAADAMLNLDRLYSMVHPEDRQRTLELIDGGIANHSSVDGEFRTVSSTGRIRWVRARGRAYYDSDGKATRFDGITIDNTHQREIEARLKGSEARYRLLVDSLKDYGVFMQDDAGNVTSWNPGAERLLGYSEAEILGRSARIFFTPEDQARGVFEHEMRTAITTGRASDDRWHLRKNGTRFFVNGMMVALYDDEGHHLGFAKIMRDMTDRQLAAAERERLLEGERKARAEAERTSQLKDEFLATLSHELRTPLNAILGWTQVLKESLNDPAQLEQGLEVIDRNTRLQAELIEDLLDMSRIVSGKIHLELRTVNVAALVDSALESVRTAAEAREIKLNATFPTEETDVVADRHRIQQIVLNLLSNAIKFTPPQGTITVRLEPTADAVSIAISDTGVGISPDFLPHVFERFRQADASTTRQHGGLGLGLAIVKQLVELHDGSVKAESAGEGQGATFRVSIPRRSRNLEAPVPSNARFHSLKPPPLHSIDLNGIKVLVVDDEPDSAGLVKRVLEARHAEVRSAGSMQEALKVCHEFHPNILLSDIGMPFHDGYELIRRVRDLPEGASIRAAALTALARKDDVERALHAGFETHVAKPVEPAELVNVTAMLAGIIKDDSSHGNP